MAFRVRALVFCLVVAVVAGALAADKAKDAKKEKAAKKAQVVRLLLTGSMPEQTGSAGLFAELRPPLRTTLQRLVDAGEDASVAAVWLRIEDLGIGRGTLNEIRDAIARYRKSEKPIYAELTGGDATDYLVAAACDQIVMPPSGTLLIPGVRAEMTFYKGLFDKLGIQYDLLQCGKFKGAGEPFTRNEMSPELRESMEAIVDDVYAQVAEMIAESRNMPDHRAKTLIDQGLFSATAAKRAGLIDQLAYADQIDDLFKKKLKADEIRVVTNYKKKQIDADFSGMGGLFKLSELFFGGGKTTDRGTSQKRIAIVYAVGTIMEGQSAVSILGGETVGSKTLASALRTAEEDPKVAAVVLRINSPGGSAIASDLIWREVTRMKKPVVASMGNVAASGGYYIAMGTKKIIAEPGTLTGSIGVIGGKLVMRGLFEKVGVNTEVISRGQNAGAVSMMEPFSPSERQAWKALMNETYKQFVAKAAQGRKMSAEELEKLAQGRVYTGRMALDIGLVDQLGTLNDAIAEAKQLAKIGADEKVDLLILPKAKSFFEQLFEDRAAAAEVSTSPLAFNPLAREIGLWKRILSEPTLLMLPCRVELK